MVFVINYSFFISAGSIQNAVLQRTDVEGLYIPKPFLSSYYACRLIDTYLFTLPVCKSAENVEAMTERMGQNLYVMSIFPNLCQTFKEFTIP